VSEQNPSIVSKKRIHFVGICGVALSAEAIAFKNAGYQVSGSDKGFFPPVSVALEEAGIPFYAGWHPEKMVESGKPDLVVAISYANETNPEIAYARENSISIISDAEVRGRYFAKEKSIVSVGTWGKTTTSALMSHTLESAGMNPSYMIGGLLRGGRASAKLTDGNWSVLEGDEYKTSTTDLRPKFFHCNPTHILLSGVSWDHADLYPTEDAYFEVFEDLINSIPESGLIVACVDHPGVRRVIGLAKTRVVTYGKRTSADYRYVKVGESKNGLRFGILRGKEAFAIESKLLGNFQAENITGCFALAKELGVPVKDILSSISSFQGIKRRMEKRFENAKVTIIDDIAHSPEKAKSALRDIHSIYKRSHVVAVFEPNIGSRTGESAVKYTDAFSSADTVLIPRLTKLKTDSTGKLKPLEGPDLAKLIARSHSGIRYIENDEELVATLANLTSLSPKHTVIAFLGSHGFRGMIEDTIARLS
jgi:UDP-N-acetylmuramate: L-alanyl-gamma-D-glutamyl-meso-diaminopimelate ligase